MFRLVAKLRPRGKNRWEIVVELPRHNGERRQISRTFHGTKREAADRGYELEVEVQQGRHDTKPGSVGSLLEQWYAIASPNWSPSTRRQNRGIIDGHLAALAETPLRRLRTHAIDQFYARLSARGLKPATVQRVHVVLHRGLAQGVRWGWLVTNPASAATKPRVIETEVEPPEATDVVALIASAEKVTPDLAVFLRLAAVTGARPGELCGLRWRDVDDTGLVIRHNLVDAGGGQHVLKGTKSDKRRRVSLDAGTLEVLRVHRLTCAQRCLATGRKPDWVFESPRREGVAWRPNWVSHRFADLRDALKLPSTLRLYDLRHFNASQMLAAGIDVRTGAGRLGHEDGGRQLLSRYGHRLAATDQRAADALGDVLG